MRSQKIRLAVQALFTRWFTYRAIDQVSGETVPMAFLHYKQTPKSNFIPVALFWKVDKVLIRELAILRGPIESGIARRDSLLNRWLCYSEEAYRVKLRDKQYYLGHGYILDSELHPLLVATLSVERVRKGGITRDLIHTPTLHIAPELLTDRFWKNLVIDYMIPLALNSSISLRTHNPVVPKKWEKVSQSIAVNIADLSGFMRYIEAPSLSADINQEINSLTSKLTELPAVTY